MARTRVRELNLASPPEVLQLEMGDTCRVTTQFNYSGPPVSAVLHIAIGTVILGVFDELVSKSKPISIPERIYPAKTYEGYVDINITHPMKVGTGYDIYAKLRQINGFPDVFSPIYENVIEVIEVAPTVTIGNFKWQGSPEGKPWGYWTTGLGTDIDDWKTDGTAFQFLNNTDNVINAYVSLILQRLRDATWQDDKSQVFRCQIDSPGFSPTRQPIVVQPQQWSGAIFNWQAWAYESGETRDRLGLPYNVERCRLIAKVRVGTETITLTSHEFGVWYG